MSDYDSDAEELAEMAIDDLEAENERLKADVATKIQDYAAAAVEIVQLRRAIADAYARGYRDGVRHAATWVGKDSGAWIAARMTRALLPPLPAQEAGERCTCNLREIAEGWNHRSVCPMAPQSVRP